jgi:riboflavin kinase/FMN adenylyltransferase
MIKKSIVTIGTFDGVHKGHRFLINETLALAKKNNLRSIVISLEKPVKKVSGLLTTCDEKIDEIKTLGVDEIIIISVPSEILNYSSDKFFDDFLIDKLNISEIVCGCDFTLGKDRKGDVNWLKRKARDSNVKVNVVGYLKSSFKQVSSSYIRSLLLKGDVENAEKLLGRSYSFSGIPFKDRGIGKKLGFPTINLKVVGDKLLPNGVYISLISQKNCVYPSITNIGSRLTFNIGDRIIPETHILNFESVWEKTLTRVTLIKKIRNDKKFKNSEELKVKIKRDVIKALRFFKLGRLS